MLKILSGAASAIFIMGVVVGMIIAGILALLI